jgi:hypothetical protein
VAPPGDGHRCGSRHAGIHHARAGAAVYISHTHIPLFCAKRGAVSYLVGYLTTENLWAEIAKCDLERIAQTVTPFAIGMSAEIEDIDAITYAAQFYFAVANGQSVESAHLSGQAALKLAGLDGCELPILAWAIDVDPGSTILVAGLDEIAY